MGMNFTSIQLIPLSTYEVLLNSKGVMGAIIAHFFFKDKMNLTEKIICFIGFIGVILVVKPGLIMMVFFPNSSYDFHDENIYGRVCII